MISAKDKTSVLRSALGPAARGSSFRPWSAQDRLSRISDLEAQLRFLEAQLRFLAPRGDDAAAGEIDTQVIEDQLTALRCAGQAA